MSDLFTKPPKSRSRASRACQRCSQRKVRCDVAESGVPCSRCRLDAIPDCSLSLSRRGTYQRTQMFRRRPRDETSMRSVSVGNPELGSGALTPSKSCSQPTLIQGMKTNQIAMSDGLSGPQTNVVSGDPITISHGMPAVSQSPVERHSVLDSACSSSVTSDENRTAAQAKNRNSLAGMFEDFLDNQGHTHEGSVPKLGVIFFSESSPLTFALEELQRSEQRSLYDPVSHINEGGVVQRNTHPSHMSPQDIAYLQSKGAFESPSARISATLVAAFLDRFYPLYSIINKDQFMELHEQQGLPWILLHTVCFIGATFCDISAVHQAGFEGRWHARRFFYDKAKVLFDVGYETNKVVLLQTVIMLSFWGPQMKSFWNPCSWIGFGSTIAESLGINRRNQSTRIDPKSKSLLRRLWWTLAVRDAYCAALLGRPFRINISQCDTEMLDLADFDHDTDCAITNRDSNCHTHYTYQIQVAKLSLVLRKIVEVRFGPPNHSITLQDLHELSNRWQADLPREVDWSLHSTPNNPYATYLRVIFNHHLIFIHLNKPHSADNLSTDQQHDNSVFHIAESAAQMISSTALSLMTNSIVGLMPHEVFPGFFIAGIVFYRQFRQSQQSVYAQLGRAALDNCQMVMNEARERWDPALWAMKIFDFLLSGANGFTKTPSSWALQNPPAGVGPVQSETTQEDPNDGSTIGVPDKNVLHSIDLESPQYEDMNRTLDDFFLIPSYFDSTPDVW
ncbi:uncharacterized protein Z519_12181 [Cladophialophora bantiana CBS 173.52]|uniref:Zn(2)-C6 fungal-type domain-containing protein n=1 Tax=Cladophialophora bantiana (strain ATCC 10958 / CBS 173.52 / CDC B-1940 / NIH 8579) TaxID=1442370 RepID=A0A0D2H1W6_CLAB1|nr:uncharacterized protein Z519_12181 [Cladophialophora bantiana CBS 173.52]KIW87278.1 hypothetical protein Z519_12181 [Cladophialophora bantiana CBS 173.52]